MMFFTKHIPLLRTDIQHYNVDPRLLCAVGPSCSILLHLAPSCVHLSPSCVHLPPPDNESTIGPMDATPNTSSDLQRPWGSMATMGDDRTSAKFDAVDSPVNLASLPVNRLYEHHSAAASVPIQQSETRQGSKSFTDPRHKNTGSEAVSDMGDEDDVPVSNFLFPDFSKDVFRQQVRPPPHHVVYSSGFMAHATYV